MMKFVRKIIFLIAILLIYLGCIPAQVLAAGEFTTSLLSTYTVQSDGTTRVHQDFGLRNNLSTVYATEYALEIGSNRIKNIAVSSNGQTLQTKITPQSSKTSIAFSFPDKVVGKDQVRSFTVSYDSSDIAVKTGNVLELNIPKLANTSEFETYRVIIKVDSNYGTPAVSQPKNFTARSEGKQSVIEFTNVGQDTGISVLFGREQIAQLQLTYNLENTSTNRGMIEVALPADSTYQRVYYDSIDPSPSKIYQDQDSNWLAQYELEPNQKLTVTAKLHTVITLTAQENAELLSKKPGNEYLKSQPYWPVGDQTIQKLAKQLKTPKAIYDYVIKTLHYDYSRLEEENKRLGASGALNNPTQSMCLEFTDLFVTIARAAGIPARAINGYAYTQNETMRPLSLVKDILHAWPEYWDETTGQWIAVDPTWENTTGGVDYFSRLDFNHIVFATHGISSEKPYPAGVYKFQNQETKDIQVEFVTTLPEYTSTFTTDLQIHAKAILGLKDSYILVMKNMSLHAVYAVPYTVTVSTQGGGTRELTGKLTLPPLGIAEIPVQLPQANIFTAQKTQVRTSIGTYTSIHDISIKSTIENNLPLILVASVVGICLAIIAFITWRLLVPRRKQKRAVRREGKKPQEKT